MSTSTPAQARQDATALALSALVFLTEDEARLRRFLGDTGLAPGDLAAVADQPATMTSVIEHILADESLLLVFTADAGLRPEAVQEAWMALTQGGTDDNAERSNEPLAGKRKKGSKRWPGPDATG